MENKSLLLICLISLIFVSCKHISNLEKFPDTTLIDKNLVRNVSTKTDVEKLLGIPNGTGGAILPGFGENSEILDSYESWYYENISTKELDKQARFEGAWIQPNINEDPNRKIMYLESKQQILVVFFKKDKFYGYFWTSNDKKIDIE